MKSKARKSLDKDRGFILWLFDGRCVRCGKPTNVIHEINPISHGNSALHWRNRVPLCDYPDHSDKVPCHKWAHEIGTDNSIPELQALRRKALIRKFNLIDTESDFGT